jgi:protein-S-isoprenylcysteine O-methyltransferase Ste14
MENHVAISSHTTKTFLLQLHQVTHRLETMSPPVKVILLILAGIALRIGFTPPQPPPTTEDRVLVPKTLFEKIMRRLTIFSQVRLNPQTLTSADLRIQGVGIVSLMIECAMLLALYFGSSTASLSAVCATNLPPLSTISTLSPMFNLAVGMVYTGGLLRLWCYKTLGTLFTYEITIRPDHKLITSGPYAIVRHPSYTACTLQLSGIILAVLSPYGYVHECGLMSTPARWVFLVWVMELVYTAISLLGRGSFEDAALKKEFGVSWETYRRSVSCRFIPGVV